MDLRGKRFGCLVALRLAARNKWRQRVWECRCDCGRLTYVITGDLTRGHTKSCYCGIARRRELNPNWGGGRKVSTNGYVFVKAPVGHPRPDANDYILEHRLVMESKIGRYLKPWECVHHIDGDTQNNSPENLELFKTKGYHTQWHRRLEEIALYD